MPTYRSLDVCRFFAALLVVVGHFNDGFMLQLESLTPIALRFGLFVDFFFILSGFVIALNYADRITSLAHYGDFIWRRIARLWPLHAVMLLFCIMLGFAGQYASYTFKYPEIFWLSGIPFNALLMHAWGLVWHQSFNVASWSISAEMFVYLLFPIMVWQARRWQVWINLATITVFVLAFASAREFLGQRPWYQASYDLGALRAVPSFFLGVVIHNQLPNLRQRLQLSWSKSWAVLCLALLAMHVNLPAELVILLFGSFVGAAALAEENRPNGWFTSPLCKRLGDASYGLYMVHMPLLPLGLYTWRRVSSPDNSYFLGVIGAIALATISLAIALLVYRFFEDPMRKRLNAFSPFKASNATRAKHGQGNSGFRV